MQPLKNLLLRTGELLLVLDKLLRIDVLGLVENHIQLDLSNPNQTIEAIEEIKTKIGPNLHALVNNAAFLCKNGLRLNTLNTDLKTWGQVFHVNFFASVVLARGLQKN